MYSMRETHIPYNLFYSYAEEDTALVVKLEKHLSTMERLGEIQGLQKRQISAGEDWQRQIKRYMDESCIILLLISPNFIASDHYFNREMKYALKRREENKAYIIPIILRPGDYEGLEFNTFEVLPANGKAITDYSDQNRAFKDVAQCIRRAVQNLREFDAKKQISPIDPSQYQLPSLYPPKVNTNSVSTSPPPVKTTNTQAKKRTTGTQRAAQTARTRAVPVTSIKTLPSKQSSFFSSEELDIYIKGKYKDLFRLMLFFCAGIDVFGLAFLSTRLSTLQSVPITVFLVSICFYTLGIFNINIMLGAALAALYLLVWLIGLLRLQYNLVLVLAFSFTWLIMRLLIFLSHQKRVYRKNR